MPRESISIVTPCHNHGEYLSLCWDSIKAELETGSEWIIVDDGSTDDTPRRIAELTVHPAVKTIRTEHAGLAAARNAGIAASRFNRILFLDADDAIPSGAIPAMKAALSPASVFAYVYGHSRTFGDTEESWIKPQFNLFALMFSNHLEPAVLIRKSIVKSVGGFRSVGGWDGYSDWDLWLRLAAKGHFGQRLNRDTLLYRRRGGSMISQADLSPGRFESAVWSANPELYGRSSLLRLKRRWSPGLTLVTPSAPSPSAIHELESRFRDFEICSPEGQVFWPPGALSHPIRPSRHLGKYQLDWNGESPNGFADKVLEWVFLREHELPDTGPAQALANATDEAAAPLLEPAFRRTAPVWLQTRLPQDLQEVDGPYVRLRRLVRAARRHGRRRIAWYGAGRVAARLMKQAKPREKPIVLFDDRVVDGGGALNARPPAELPFWDNLIVTSDQYSRALYRRAMEEWPGRARRIHALYF